MNMKILKICAYLLQKKRTCFFITISAACLFLTSGLSAAEIAAIKSKNIEPYNLSLKGFKEVVKANLKVNNMEASLEKGSIIIKNIKSKKPDLILVLGAKAAYIASNNVRDIPIVFSMVSDPKRYKISGDNVTGVKLDIPLEKQFHIYKEVMPGIKKIGVIFSKDQSKAIVDEGRSILEGMGIRLISKQIFSQKEIPAALEKTLSDVDALWLIFDPVVTASPRIVREVILFHALRKRIPVIGFNKWSVTVGALCTFYSEYEDIGRQAGAIANRILQGADPSSIPVESPDKVRIFFNEKVMERVSSKVKLNIPGNAFIWGGE